MTTTAAIGSIPTIFCRRCPPNRPLDVTYFLPTLTPGEVAAHGRRAYHGYVVRLYYQNKLQDVAAEPRDLLDFGLPTSRPEAGAAHPLLPPVAR